jgi:hypothetical protein
MKFRFFMVCSLIMIFLSQICAQPPRQISLMSGKRYGFPIRKKPTKEQKKQLSPSSEDLTVYARFLEQADTGIFRLLPDLKCDENPLVIKADEECLKAIPESSFYSFREREHTMKFLSDIRLENNHLVTNGIMAQGILVSLGDVPLENVSLKSEGLAFLNAYSAHTSAAEAQKQFFEIARGVNSGEYEYRKAFPVKVDTTFALRVIAYRGSIYRTFRGYHYDLLEGDERVDLTLAFRVIRKDSDGGVTLLWKELRRRKSPRIEFPKGKTRF